MAEAVEYATCPFDAVRFALVPPWGRATWPESEIVGVAPPDEERGDDALTLVTVPVP